MSHQEYFSDPERLAAFERRVKDFAERLRQHQGHFDFSELGDLPEEERKFLLGLLAVGAGIGLGAIGLYLGKRVADGVARTDLPQALRQMEALPAEIAARIRAGWSGMARREQRIIIPDE